MITSLSWPHLLTDLLDTKDLDHTQAQWAMDTIMAGEAAEAQIAGFLIALRAKGVTVTELSGFADSMLANARTLPITVPPTEGTTDLVPALDIVGTGGDRQNTVNISTMATLVCAGAGIPIIKHGNRASSSAAGSADVLEALGVRLDLSIPTVAQSFDKVGISFCFAQVFHPSFRHTATARKALGIPTAFNFLGPITNPGHVAANAVGVADATMAPIIAGVFASRGNSALVFRGDDGLDELSLSGPSSVWEVHRGSIQEQRIHPADLGLTAAPVEELRGQDAEYNAEVVRRVLAGERGAVRDAVVLNAAAGLVAYAGLPEASHMVPGLSGGSLAERLITGIVQAQEAIDSGAAQSALARWVEFSSEN